MQPLAVSDEESIYSEIDDSDEDPNFVRENNKRKKTLRHLSPNPSEHPSDSEEYSYEINENENHEEIPLTDNGFPSKNCRIGNKIKLILPITDAQDCTEEHTTCPFSTDQDSYSKIYQNLKRHLARKHRIEVDTLEKWCSVCKQQIILKHGSMHLALKTFNFHRDLKKRFNAPNATVRLDDVHNSIITEACIIEMKD